MNSRQIYGYGLIAGMSCEEMRHQTPGFILDMFKMRSKYDMALSGAKAVRKLTGA